MTHSHHRKGPLSIVLLISVAYMLAEFVGGVLSGSLALIADAGHMLIDVAAIALGLFALWIAQKPPDNKKTFGYYRAEILAALINGAALIAVSIWILFEAWYRFQTPRPIDAPIMTAIASGGLVVNLIALKLLHPKGSESLNVRGVWLHILSDTLSSFSTILGGIAIWMWGWNWLDPVLSVLLSVLILWGSWKLLSESVNVLLEGVPENIDIDDIRKKIESLPAVRDVHDLHVWTVSSSRNAVSAHVRLEENQEYGRALETITQLLKKEFGMDHVTIQVEPASYTLN